MKKWSGDSNLGKLVELTRNRNK